MSIGFWQILLIAALVILLFGRGKISGLMGDVAQGIKSFRKGMKDDDDKAASNPDLLELEAEKRENAANAKPKERQHG